MTDDRGIEQQLQHAADAMSARLAGRSVGQVAAVLATDPIFQPLLEVPAFIEWVATEISGGRRPAIKPDRSERAVPAASFGPRLHALATTLAEPVPDEETTWTDRLDRVLTTTGSIVAFLQPIVNLRTREVVGYEALARFNDRSGRSEEHTSELQSLRQLVCRLLLEKKKT